MLKTVVRRYAVLFLIFFFRQTVFSQEHVGGIGMRSLELTEGASVTFKADATHSNSYQWFKDDIAISGATQANFKITESGIYTVLAYNSTNCSSVLSDAVRVIVNQVVIKNEANLTIVKKSEIRTTAINDPFEYTLKVTNKGPDTATEVVIKDIFPEGLVLKDISTPLKGVFDYNAALRTLTWKMDSLQLLETVELRFRAESMNPGLVINSAHVSAEETDNSPADNHSTDQKEVMDIIIPNVFTPNGDGVNDRFEIRHLNLYTENEISIINRWGNSIYEKKNYENSWDGNGLDEGTYFYILKVKNATGSWKAYKGYITLLRTITQ